MSQAKNICSLCGKPNQTSFNGSLTQWVSLCRCDQLVSPVESDNTIEICLKCEKRIGAGRSGTFTQWIFRADVCSCPVPKPVAKSIKNLSDGEFEKVIVDLSSIVEIEVDKSKFPIDRFAPLETISSTYNSTIYLSIDRLLGTRVAIKIIKLGKPSDIVRFQKEVKALGSLSHPGLVKVLDFAEKNGAPYMVMEYVEGMSLREYLLRNLKLTVEDTIHVVINLCETLDYCHSKNVLHRDVKPENILISNSTESLEIKLVDFGLACTIDTISSQNSTIAGTPLYMAPDTSNGYKFDVRSEIYSIGCIMFELLTGSPPYEDVSALALLKLHAEAEIPTLSIRSPDDKFDTHLENIVSKCLAKEPADRFHSMEELRSSVSELIGGVSEVLKIELEDTSNQHGKDTFEAVNKLPKSVVLYIVLSFVGLIAVCCTFLASDQDVQKLLGIGISRPLKKAEVASTYPLDASISHATVIGVAGRVTQEFNFSGSNLTDKQLDHLAVVSPEVKRFSLDNCLGISVSRLASYFSKVKPEEVILSNKSCAPKFIKTLIYNQNLKRLGLKNVDDQDLAAIPHEMRNLDTLMVMDSKVGNLNFQKLKSIASLTSLTFVRCSNFSSSLGQISYLKVNALELDNCLIRLSDFDYLKRIEPLKSLSLKSTKFLNSKETLASLNKEEAIPALASVTANLVRFPDAVLTSISDMSLKNLFFSKYEFGKNSILKLAKMKNLESLKLSQCVVSSESIDLLKTRLPDTKFTVSRNK